VRKISGLCLQGKTIRLLLADYEDSADSALETGNCLQVHHMKKPLHAKVMMKDKKSAFV
jgi:hypothetical protein